MSICTHGKSLEEPCLRCAMTAGPTELHESHVADGFAVGIHQERQRIRAIVLHLFGSEWTGNKALEWIDSGKHVEELKGTK